MDRPRQTTALSRRTFLTTASTALVGAVLGGGLAPSSEAAKRHPTRGGALLLASQEQDVPHSIGFSGRPLDRSC